jgi:DNA-binding MarR family transcriptional regulator
MTENRCKILAMFFNDPKITNREIADSLDISMSAVKSNVNSLINAGFISSKVEKPGVRRGRTVEVHLSQVWVTKIGGLEDGRN